VGGPPRKLFAKSLMALIHALRIDGGNNVNSANTTTSFKNKVMELVCSMFTYHDVSMCQRFSLRIARPSCGSSLVGPGGVGFNIFRDERIHKERQVASQHNVRC
jgi:hypothetical protein